MKKKELSVLVDNRLAFAIVISQSSGKIPMG